MARTQTIVQLTDDLVEQLDAEADLRGISRSALIREAVAEHLQSGRQERITAVLVDGYRRIPQGAADEWGDLSGEVRESTRRTLRRLDAEESEAGETW
jgi:predicted transcriptional regulator